MQANKLPSIIALIWLKDSWRVFLTQPALLFFATFSYWFFISLASSIPVIGVILPSVLLPLFSLAMMEIVRAIIEKGELRVLKYFIHRDKDGLCIRRLILSGLLNFLYLLLVVFIISSIFNENLWLVASGQKMLSPIIINSDGFLVALLITTLFLLPAVAASWYSPMLIAWHNLPVLQAFIYSLIAVWRNLKAFLFYFTILVLINIVLSLLASILLKIVTVILPGSKLISSLVAMLPLLFLIAIAPAIFISFYYTYLYVFKNTEGGLKN